MSEKDPYSDKLHDKGKADEDRWIAEQERQRLARLKEAASTGSGTCPRDGSKLVPHKANLVTVEACPTCRGVWMGPGEIEVLVRQDNEGAVIHWVRSLFQA
jgi:hypothetical protein